MNYQLILHGFLLGSISKENRLDYYNALEEYAVKSNLNPLTGMVAKLEEEHLNTYLKLISAI